MKGSHKDKDRTTRQPLRLNITETPSHSMTETQTPNTNLEHKRQTPTKSDTHTTNKQPTHIQTDTRPQAQNPTTDPKHRPQTTDTEGTNTRGWMRKETERQTHKRIWAQLISPPSARTRSFDTSRFYTHDMACVVLVPRRKLWIRGSHFATTLPWNGLPSFW